MESKPFPRRHAESTSQLEMYTESKNQPSKRHNLELYKLQNNRKHSGKARRRISKSRYEKFHKLFKNIPESEVPINYYSCAYFGDILLHGYMYVSANYICFYTKILGRQKLIEIPLAKVLKITRERTAFIIPNAIGIATDKEKYVFGSFIARDSTYSLMCKLWTLHQDGEISSLSTKYDSELDTSTTGAAIGDENSMHSIHEQDGCTNPKIELTMGSSGETSSVDSVNMSGASPCPHCLNRGQSSTGGIECDCEETGIQPKDCLYQNYKTYRNMSYTNQCSEYGKLYPTLNRLVTRVQSLPRTSFLLAICSVLVLFLTVSAVMMLYKILLLQAQLEGGVPWSSHEEPCNKIKMFSDVYFLRNQFHTSTIERFHSVMQANLQVLDQVYESLKQLQSSAQMLVVASTDQHT